MDSFVAEDSGDVMNEINMIPFIDIMLVLLIIFIITVPVLHQSVNVDLPQASSVQEIIKPETLQLSITADGSYFLDKTPVTAAELEERLAADAQKTPQPELHIRGDRAVPYGHVAQAMAAAEQAGMTKMGFITEAAAAAGPAK
jgi:biopolymer transport protein ExbD